MVNIFIYNNILIKLIFTFFLTFMIYFTTIALNKILVKKKYNLQS